MCRDDGGRTRHNTDAGPGKPGRGHHVRTHPEEALTHRRHRGVWTVENSSDRISVSRSDKTTTLRINTADLGGQSIRVTLSPALPKPTKPSLRASSYPLGLPHTSS